MSVPLLHSLTIFGQVQRLPGDGGDPLLVPRQRPPALLPRLGVPHDHRAGLKSEKYNEGR